MERLLYTTKGVAACKVPRLVASTVVAPPLRPLQAPDLHPSHPPRPLTERRDDTGIAGRRADRLRVHLHALSQILEHCRLVVRQRHVRRTQEPRHDAAETRAGAQLQNKAIPHDLGEPAGSCEEAARSASACGQRRAGSIRLLTHSINSRTSVKAPAHKRIPRPSPRLCSRSRMRNCPPGRTYSSSCRPRACAPEHAETAWLRAFAKASSRSGRSAYRARRRATCCL